MKTTTILNNRNHCKMSTPSHYISPSKYTYAFAEPG